MKLIDKDALVAEMESRIKSLEECFNGKFPISQSVKETEQDKGKLVAYKSILSFIDTLEVKEVDSKLTLEDIEIILGIENNILHECNDNCQLVIEAYPKGQDYYGEILRRFNNQRIKPQRMISAEAKEAMYNKPANEYESLTDFGKQMKK